MGIAGIRYAFSGHGVYEDAVICTLVRKVNLRLLMCRWKCLCLRIGYAIA